MSEDPQGHLPAHDHVHEAAGPVADASVRTARASDAPAVGVVQAAVFREAYAGRVPPGLLDAFVPEAFARGWRVSLEQPPEGVHRLFVACAGAQVVGIAAIGPSQDPDAGAATGEIALLGVHPQARRQGHGARLLHACVDTLREAGADEVTVWLLADDEAGRAYLAAAGFAPDSAWRDRALDDRQRPLREVRLTASLAGLEEGV